MKPATLSPHRPAPSPEPYRWRDVVPRTPGTALETTLVVLLVCAVFYFGSQLLDLVSADVRAWLAGGGR